MRWFFTIFISLIATIHIFAQEEIVFSVSAPDSIPPNTPFAVTFTLENAQEDFETPNWGRLELMQGPAVSSQYSNVNGNVSQSISYTYYLSAPAEGRYFLEPATAFIDKKAYKTAGIKIIAQEGAALPKDISKESNNDFFEGFFRRGQSVPPTPPTPRKSTKKRKLYRI